MKAKTCDWCGERIGPKDIRVKLPLMYSGRAMTYHPDCYVRVHDKQCLRALVADDYPHGERVGKALRILLAALDQKGDEEDE